MFIYILSAMIILLEDSEINLRKKSYPFSIMIITSDNIPVIFLPHFTK